MISLNSLLKKIKGIADLHSQINTYAQGNKYDFSANEALTYACLWSIPQGASMDLAGRKLDYRITLFMMDIEKADGSNQIEILSDTALILTDVIAQLQSIAQDEDTWQVTSVGTFEPFTDSFSDTVSGHSVDITLGAFYGGDICSDITN